MEEKNTKKFKFIKMLLFITAIILLIAITIKLFPLFTDLGTVDGRAKFKAEIDKSGVSRSFYDTRFTIITNTCTCSSRRTN